MNRRGTDAVLCPRTGFALFSSFLFAAAAALNRRIVFSGDIRAKLAENFIRKDFGFPDALFFLLVFAAVFILLFFLSRLSAQKERDLSGPGEAAPQRRRFALLSAFALALCWLPYLLALAPGNLFEDSMDSIGQMLAHGHPVSNHHPMFYTLTVGVFLKAGQILFHSVNAGVLLFSLIQTALMIACAAAELDFLLRRGVPRAFVILSLAWFALLPVFPAYALTMWKDIPYSCALLLLSILLADLSCGRDFRGWQAAMFFLLLAAMMTRNNGLYAGLMAGAGAWALCRRHRRGILAAVLAAALVFSALSALAVRLWRITEDFAESVGIPLQQLGYAINDGGVFSEEDKEYLFRLCPEEVWHYAYRPMLDDSLKWNPRFDVYFLHDTKARFFAVWFRGLVKNPVRYLRAYLLATYGFWSPTAAHEWGYMSVKLPENGHGICWMNPLGSENSAKIRGLIASHMPLIGSGTLFWLLLLGLTLCLVRGRPASAAAPYLPALANQLTILIATPAAFSLRYVYILALGLPLFLLYPLTDGGRRGEGL